VPQVGLLLEEFQHKIFYKQKIVLHNFFTAGVLFVQELLLLQVVSKHLVMFAGFRI
jgi:hypothetical protein